MSLTFVGSDKLNYDGQHGMTARSRIPTREGGRMIGADILCSRNQFMARGVTRNRSHNSPARSSIETPWSGLYVHAVLISGRIKSEERERISNRIRDMRD